MSICLIRVWNGARYLSKLFYYLRTPSSYHVMSVHIHTHIQVYIHTHYSDLYSVNVPFNNYYAKDVVTKISPQVELFIGIYCMNLVHNYIKMIRVGTLYRIIGKDNILRFFHEESRRKLCNFLKLVGRMLLKFIDLVLQTY